MADQAKFATLLATAFDQSPLAPGDFFEFVQVSLVAPTQELVSRDGMMGAGLNMRTGPICRTTADAAKVLDAIAGYDVPHKVALAGVCPLCERSARTRFRPYRIISLPMIRFAVASMRSSSFSRRA